MNVENFALACRFLPSTYVEQGKQSRKSHENYIKILLEHKKLPVKGWDRSTIEMLLNEISTMDSNNFLGNAGIGEREGRIASPIVVQRHYGLAHGIGRSGDIAAVQPKAAGSSLMMKLTNAMVLDAIRIAGVRSASSCIVVPMATGMSMVLTFLTIKQMRPEAKYIIWPRVDQKSCFKAIFTAGFEPIVIENILVEDELRTDVQMIEKHLKGIPPEQILCIYTTTSCFTPRAPDSLEAIGKLCKEFEIPHVVNNAYGLQSSKCTHLIEQAARSGRLDAFIQSTDKNFMVPVGGAVIAGFDDSFISKISQTYPGRASAAPVMDLFVTLLSMGVEGFKDSLIERKGMYRYLQKRLQQVASAHGERLLVTPNNAISIGITLSSMPTKHATELGSMLFTRNISGARAIAPGVTKQIGSVTFENYGSHYNNYPYAYLTAAAAIGLKKDDVNTFARRLDRVFRKLIKPKQLKLKLENEIISVSSSNSSFRN
ncbi:uncharacterized protein TRIADDRAFT_50605 [Trichoplax adhaerens]|uniref:O-phosphoseryl-tRNA(Sec) selenium transferase n=1 Tax=Trichoplax adhaerens TaxID=10228 RepID=B3S364_TRIAD|nr:hypothetical protein TRIADDRAFT_50605 [Trichoplax adhaerens]EDV22917.1 hypothetical protein TRIADDRAFT_50605 [Trichoplax adhaerens]|eukprot:XP_002114783.1 hypothetical protein TRIADDRAFT_50605 [Trichoplax adhaerens]